MKRKLLLVAVISIAVIAFCGCGKNYDDVKAKLSGNTWYYNGGSDTILNMISFGDESATINQISFDGNGAHDEGGNEFAYTIDDSNIVVTMADESEFTIPYTLDGDTFTLGNGDYFTLDEVDAGIQGIWTSKRTQTIAGKTLTSESDIEFKDGMVSSQNGTTAYDGDGFYYNVYKPTSYSLGNGTLETDMMHGNSWFFNIIGGEPTILYYDHVCSRIDKMPDAENYEL